MEKKSLVKYYLIGAIVLIVILLVILLSKGKSKPTKQNSQVQNNVSTSATNYPSTPSVTNSNSMSTNDLVGTWTSSVQGKGIVGTGKIITPNTSTTINLSSDMKIIIQKVENNIAIGTITFTNLCYTTSTSVSGKPVTTQPQKCTSSASEPARIKVSGDTLSYDGQTALSANVSFTGKYSDNTIMGTFTRMSTYGKISGALSLVRVEK
jgi:hypothetical protein